MNWKPFTETSSNPAGVIDELGRTVAEVFGPDKAERARRAKLFAGAPFLLWAAREVIANWESGDLAAAVHQLDEISRDLTEWKNANE